MGAVKKTGGDFLSGFVQAISIGIVCLYVRSGGLPCVTRPNAALFGPKTQSVWVDKSDETFTINPAKLAHKNKKIVNSTTTRPVLGAVLVLLSLALKYRTECLLSLE